MKERDSKIERKKGDFLVTVRMEEYLTCGVQVCGLMAQPSDGHLMGSRRASFDDSGNTIKDKDFEQSTAFIFFCVL